jgi:cbb3-type cytochrome oxidase maturation protein
VDILYLLIPLSAVLVLAIVAVLGWAVHSGQFDDLEDEGLQPLREDSGALDEGQVRSLAAPQQSVRVESTIVAGGGHG